MADDKSGRLCVECLKPLPTDAPSATILHRVPCAKVRQKRQVKERQAQVKAGRRGSMRRVCPICTDSFTADHPRQRYDKPECRSRGLHEAIERQRLRRVAEKAAREQHKSKGGIRPPDGGLSGSFQTDQASSGNSPTE